MFSYFDHLACSACKYTFEPTALVNLCACGAPILAQYRPAEAAEALNRATSPAIRYGAITTCYRSTARKVSSL